MLQRGRTIATCGKKHHQKAVKMDLDTSPTTGDEMGASLLYTLLPSLLQQRVPVIPSIRRTASTYASKSSKGHIRTSSDISETQSITPPPSYRTSARTSICSTDTENQAIFCSFPPSRPSSSGSTTQQDSKQGVKWKYARQGYALLSLSTQEAGVFDDSAEFSRKLYMDGLGYLLRGLPEDLSEEERVGLRAAMEGRVLAEGDKEESGKEMVETGKDESRRHAIEQPSVLHRFVADVTFYLFLALSIVIPYIQLLLQEAYRYDRKHRISERVLAQGMIAADAVGKQTWLLANNVCAMNNGKVGEAIKDVGIWWVQGVSGGVYEGFGEGMEAFGLRRQAIEGARRER